MTTVLKVAAGVLLGGALFIAGVAGVSALTGESEDASDRAIEIQRRIDAHLLSDDLGKPLELGEEFADYEDLQDG